MSDKKKSPFSARNYFSKKKFRDLFTMFILAPKILSHCCLLNKQDLNVTNDYLRCWINTGAFQGDFVLQSLD